jgi:hypothetical protein
LIYFDSSKIDQVDPPPKKLYHSSVTTTTIIEKLRFFMLPTQVLTTKGAARRLGCSETWIHKLAARGVLKAYLWGDDGELIEYAKVPKRQGRALYFLAEEVDNYRPAVQRRPRGSKNKSSPSHTS